MHHLYLHNDNKNSFKYVWAALMQELKHTPIQAEQCCLIADNVGKAHVKQGDITELLELETKLQELGLVVSISNVQLH